MRNLVCGVTALLLAAPVLADDGAASLAAGGIVFTKNAAIRMASEDLYVSPKLVRVRFEFANDTNKDVETLVAFPLPDIDLHDIWLTMIVPGVERTDPVNFVGFHAKADGKPISFRTEQRAFIGNKDVTDKIKSTGLPINLLVAGFDKIVEMPIQHKWSLRSAGVLVGGDGPAWRVRTRFFWTQRFPAHKRVVIEHSYQPVTGSWNTADAVTGSKELAARFCLGSWTVPLSAFFGSPVAMETDYILTTANSWRSPIGRFHMTLDKLKFGNALSVCWDSPLRRTGFTTYEFTASNFAPKQDIHMLVLE